MKVNSCAFLSSYWLIVSNYTLVRKVKENICCKTFRYCTREMNLSWKLLFFVLKRNEFIIKLFLYVECMYIWVSWICTCKFTNMYAYPQSDHALPHWKRVLWWCANCLCINLNDQEKDNKYSDTTPLIRLQIYHIIARCTANVSIPLKYNKYVASVDKNLQ